MWSFDLHCCWFDLWARVLRVYIASTHGNLILLCWAGDLNQAVQVC